MPMPNSSRSRLRLTSILLAAAAIEVSAQAPADPVPQPAPARQAPTVSGTIRGNYHYLLGGPREDFNQFALDRVYLTVRGPVARNTSFRVTSDVFQSDDNGWTVRMKYAYLDYVLGGGNPWATTLRAGMLQTVTIEQHEEFWPRWLGPVAVDRHGFFQSADVGVSASTALPGEAGVLFAHVVNGTGYTRRETDRFKDLGVRASLTPFAARHEGLLGSMTLSGWRYEGATAGTLGALDRDRWGVHIGIDDAPLTAAVEHSRRTDASESDVVNPGDPITAIRTAAAVSSAFAIVRPGAIVGTAAEPRLGIVARYDHVDPDTPADASYHYMIAGAIYNISSRFALSLNYQEQLGGIAPAPFRGVFANVVLDF